MSTARTHREPSTVECRNPLCDAYGKRWEFIGNDYCSHACKIEAAGCDALADVKHDHRYCFTCGAELKVVYRPERGFGIQRAWPEDDSGEPHPPAANEPPECFSGLQSRNPVAAWGEKTHPKNVLAVRTGAVCDYCGNTDHKERIDELWYDYPDHYAERLLTVVESEFGTPVDRAAFWDAYDRENFEYAVGRGVYADA